MKLLPSSVKQEKYTTAIQINAKTLFAKPMKYLISKQTDALSKSDKQRVYVLLNHLFGMQLLINVKNAPNKSLSTIKIITDVKHALVELSGIRHQRLVRNGVQRASS